MIAFLPSAMVEFLLEDESLDMQFRSEMEAELGSSHFFGGAMSDDARFLAHEEMESYSRTFRASPEGQRRAERLETAHFMDSAITEDMHVRLPGEDQNSRKTLVPIFIPGISRHDFMVAPTDEDLPF